jgi:urea carboxylase
MTTETTGARYSWGADEFLFVEMAEEMSLAAYRRSMAVTRALSERRPEGVTEICPANASFQVRFDPEVLAPGELRELVGGIVDEVGDAGDVELESRIVEIPVLYDDPWTHETLMRFRDNHQDPDATDLEYGARINGFASKEEFIAAHHASPWMATMVGFVAGLPFLYQLVERDRQLEVPKYVTPRTDTPKQTVGHGGCFGCIYSVRGAGYQMFGITPAPIYDPHRSLPDFAEFECFFRPGDIVKFDPIGRERYDELEAAFQHGEATIRRRSVSFDLDAWTADPDAYNAELLEVLRAD